MNRISEALDRAMEFEQSGDWPTAGEIYRQIILQNAQCVDAWFRLGTGLLKQRRHRQAVEALQRVTELSPELAEGWSNLGCALAAQRDMPQAIVAFRRAVEAAPQRSDLCCNLAMALREAGDYPDALVALNRYLERDPTNPSVLYNLAATFLAAGHPQQAMDSLRRLIQFTPQHLPGSLLLGELYSEAGDSASALAVFQHAAAMAPQSAEARVGLGIALAARGETQAAIHAFRQALERAPESAEAHANLGNALRLAHRNDEALLSLQRALQICPDHPLALLNLGVVLAHQRRVEEATDCFRAAIRRKPEFATAHHNLGIQLLLQGNWEEGWKEYAWRWRCSEFAPRIFRQPLWNGQPLPGGTILLHTEQGMGDTILFIRYAALVKQRVDRVIVQCPACMIPLLSHCAGIDQLVPEDGELPPFDVYAPLLNVPGLVGSVPGNVPADVPYLFADCDRVAWYRDRLMAENAFKVGIVWRGNPNYITDAQRSARLQDFEPVARVPGVRLFCLQKDATAEEWQVMRGRVPLADPGAPAPVAAGAFVNTAAAMQQMDLIISIDSAPAHLAGALARPVWVALAYAADWRWLRDREDTVWYPTMRLFRQHRPGDWGGVFSRMADQLPAQMAISRRSGQVPPHEK